jgi:hypothetical protein
MISCFLGRVGLNLRSALFAVGALVLLSGCVRDDPAFLVSDMAAAPSIVGAWVGKDQEGKEVTLTVTEDVQAGSGGRLMARGSGGYDDAVAKKATVPVYGLRADFGMTPTEPAADGDEEKAVASSLRVRGYLLRADGLGDGEYLLCIQSEEEEGKPLGSIFTVNTQWMLGVKVSSGGDGVDRLTVRMPSVLLLLSPATQLLDPPAVTRVDAECPAVEQALRVDAEGKVVGGSFLSNNADRVLAVCRRYGSRPGFWREPLVEYTRRK